MYETLTKQQIQERIKIWEQFNPESLNYEWSATVSEEKELILVHLRDALRKLEYQEYRDSLRPHFVDFLHLTRKFLVEQSDMRTNDPSIDIHVWPDVIIITCKYTDDMWNKPLSKSFRTVDEAVEFLQEINLL